MHPSTIAIEPLPKEIRCSYQSKFCNNHRAMKPSGDLHKLCEFHRKKANLNQKRMQQRRRMQLRNQQQAARRCAYKLADFSSFAAPTLVCDYVAPAEDLLEPFVNVTCEDFSADDLKVLECILFDPTNVLQEFETTTIYSPEIYGFENVL